MEPLHETMGRMSHREYLMRIAWLDKQWNEPDRTDHYLMQIAAEVRRVLAKKPKSIKLSHFKLPFTFKKRNLAKPELTEEQKAAMVKASKSFWTGLVGLARKIRPQKHLKDPLE